MENIKKHILYLFIIIVFAIVAWQVLLVGAEKQQIVDCYKWQQYEVEFSHFELGGNNKRMCDELGITIK